MDKIEDSKKMDLMVTKELMEKSPVIIKTDTPRKKQIKYLDDSELKTKTKFTKEGNSESEIETLNNIFELSKDIKEDGSDQETDTSTNTGSESEQVKKKTKKKDNITMEYSDIKKPVVQPKKRGRPRKYPLLHESNTSSSDQTELKTTLDHFEEKTKVLHFKLEQINDKPSSSDTFKNLISSSLNQTPVKKRGRKKKSDNIVENYEMGLTPDDMESLTKAGIFDEVEIELSKSGRKRKKINYFDLENNFLNDKIINRKLIKQKLSNSENKKFKPKSKQQLNINNEEVGVSISESSITEPEEKKEPPKEQNECDVPDTSDSVKEKKYKYTGETTKMIRSIFSAAFKDSLTTDVEDGDTPQTKNYSRGRGRKRIEENNTILDEENNVTCMTCKNKIPSQDWTSHNRNIHYNLSWREGDIFLNIDDELFLKKTLKPILQEDKKLTCYKCDRSSISVNDYIVHKEECEGVVLGGQVTCAICEEQMDKSKWSFHKKRKHNNLSWRIGDPPLDLGNQNLVLDILNGLYKAKIPLHCYKCNSSKKSVVGFLSHQAQCGLNEEDVKIKCPHCTKKILPVSLQSHLKMVHAPRKEQSAKLAHSDEADVNLGKRKAAKTALAMIDSLSKQKPINEHQRYFCDNVEFRNHPVILKLLKAELANEGYILCKFENCQMKNENLESFWKHMNACEYKYLEYYGCTRCCALYSTEEKIKEHLVVTHHIALPNDDNYTTTDEDEDDEETYFKYRKFINRKRKINQVKYEGNKNVKLKPRFICNVQPYSSRKLFQCAFEYTLEFYNEHYTQSVVFDFLRYLKSNWNLLKDDLLSEYLPKNEESCDMNCLRVTDFENVYNQEHTLKKLELFQVEQQKDGVTTIFCGGPIFAMAWLPTPHIFLRCNQVLAVAVGNDFDSKYFINSNYNEPSVIQFWDCGILKNKIKPAEPELLFCLAIDDGPVWHLEWCPSGCYDENMPSNKNQKQRMGLLAVAGSSPNVSIYSVPFLEVEEKGLVYKCKPLLKLRMTVTDNLKKTYFPTKISWGKASGHKFIAVGYTDGMIAMFNLDKKSKIVKLKDEEGIETLLPYKTVKAHLHYISVLSLIHQGGGARWLLTGSFDSNIYLWDLTNNTKTVYSRNKIVSDGTWLTNWVSYIVTNDESNTRNSSIMSGVIAHRNYLYEPVYLNYSPSSFTALSSSDWLNGIINGNGEGEIIATFPHQLVYSLDNYKKWKNHRYCMSYARLIHKHKSPEERLAEEIEKEKSLVPVNKSRNNQDVDSCAYLFSKSSDFCDKYEPLTYKEINEKYAIAFCDMTLNTFDDFSVEKQDKLTNPLTDLQASRPNLYPLKKVNKICFNPNCQASLYFATGYQAGFVRLTYMKFLENDQQVV